MAALCGSTALPKASGSDIKPLWLTGYVAVGDSYSAGVGTQSSRVHDTTCDRTTTAWPNLLAKELRGLKPFHNVACSGARIADLFQSYRNEWAQLQQARMAEAAVLTVTVGGNDVGFSDVLLNCYTHDCTGALLRAEQTIAQLGRPLAEAFERLKWESVAAKVFVVGYPRIFPVLRRDTVNCGWLSDRERETVNLLTSQLDATEQKAARTAGVHYISTLRALNGHELCSRASWVFALRPTCVADARCGHPLEAGQRALAAAVDKVLWPAIDGQLPGLSRWPTQRHDHPAALNQWPANLIKMAWSSCTEWHCIVGDGKNAVHLFRLTPGEPDELTEIHSFFANLADPWVILEGHGLSNDEVSGLLSPTG